MNSNLEPISKAEKQIIKKISDEQKIVETKFPLLFGLMATFGFVSVLYGFEKLIDEVDFLINNPWILLLSGLFILFLTGAVYRKLN